MRRAAEILRKIDDNRQEITAFSQKLIRFKSVNPPGNEEEISNFLAEKLKKFDFMVDQIEYAPNRPNIIAVRKGTRSDRKLLCYAHMDVVPAGDLSKWILDPFAGQIVDDKLYGRGSQDHKFPIAPFIYAWKSLDDLNIKLKGDLAFTFVVNEESGGEYGFKRLVEDGYFDDTESMIYGGIGSLTQDAIIIACNGLRNYLITVSGKCAHTGWLENGINAIVNAARLIIDLQKLADKVNTRKHKLTGSARMSINMIRGGEKENVLPDQCVITVDRRATPLEDYDEVTREILRILDTNKKKNSSIEYKVEIRDGMPPAISDPNSEIVQTIKQAAKTVTGKTLGIRGSPGSSDFSWYIRRSGKPVALYTVANAPDLFHSPNEYALIQDIVDTTKVYALTMCKFLGMEKAN